MVGRKFFCTIDSQNVLNEYLGKNWHLRVNNVYGDSPMLSWILSVIVYIEQGDHRGFSFICNACKLKQNFLHEVLCYLSITMVI